MKVTQCQSRSLECISVRFIKNNAWNFNHTWQAHITVNAHCVTITQMQKVRGQGHMRSKLHFEAWHHMA